MKTNTLLAVIVVLLSILIGLLVYMFSGQAEKRAINHIEQELNIKNEEKNGRIKTNRL